MRPYSGTADRGTLQPEQHYEGLRAPLPPWSPLALRHALVGFSFMGFGGSGGCSIFGAAPSRTCEHRREGSTQDLRSGAGRGKANVDVIAQPARSTMRADV